MLQTLHILRYVNCVGNYYIYLIDRGLVWNLLVLFRANDLLIICSVSALKLRGSYISSVRGERIVVYKLETMVWHSESVMKIY